MNLVILATCVILVSVVITDGVPPTPDSRTKPRILPQTDTNVNSSCVRWQIRTWTGADFPQRNGGKVMIRFVYDHEKKTTWMALGSNPRCNFQAGQVDVFEVEAQNKYYPPIGLELQLLQTGPWDCKKIEAGCLYNESEKFTAMVNKYISQKHSDRFMFSSRTGNNLKHRWCVGFYMSNSTEADTDAEVLIQMRSENNRTRSKMIPIPAGCDKFKPSTPNIFHLRSEFSEPVKSVKVCLGNNGHLSEVSRNFSFEKLTLYKIGQHEVLTFTNNQVLPTKEGGDCLEINTQDGDDSGGNKNQDEKYAIETAAATGEEEEGGSAWTWILTILGVMFIAGGVFGVVTTERARKKNEKQDAAQRNQQAQGEGAPPYPVYRPK